MANEIKIKQTMIAAKGYDAEDFNYVYSADWIGNDKDSNSVILTNDITILSFTDRIYAPGIGGFRNLSTTEYIEIGIVTAPEYGGILEEFSEIPPGCGISVWLKPGKLYGARSMGADARLSYTVLSR